MGKSTINGHFQIAMLNYQRVSFVVIYVFPIQKKPSAFPAFFFGLTSGINLVKSL